MSFLKKTYAIVLVTGLPFMGCQRSASSQTSPEPRLYESDKFKEYWYDGKAEISSYRLDQARYGENRDGKAVLIFVTEDFSKSKQVKLDNPGGAASDRVGVLKLNFTKNFVTGIYPYSLMTSVFAPINRREWPHPLKVTMSGQEWCGHVFLQLNLRGNQYRGHGFSYFESEGDAQFTISKSVLEDELWTLIRLDPDALPLGEFRMIPGLTFSRLSHQDLKDIVVTGSLREEGDEKIYTVAMNDLQRTLTIVFQSSFPHKITRWEETFNERGAKQTTRAILEKTLKIDYWKKNKNEFKYLRDSLNLSSTRH